MNYLKAPLLLAVLSISACSSGKIANPAPGTSSGNSLSSVEIEYGLGHYQHRFTADGGSEKAQVTTYLERDVVEHAFVDPAKYAAFVTKAIAFSEKPRREPTNESECRSPFKIVVKTVEKTLKKHTLPMAADLPTTTGL